jgi:hypothetical protein
MPAMVLYFSLSVIAAAEEQPGDVGDGVDGEVGDEVDDKEDKEEEEDGVSLCETIS